MAIHVTPCVRALRMFELRCHRSLVALPSIILRATARVSLVDPSTKIEHGLHVLGRYEPYNLEGPLIGVHKVVLLAYGPRAEDFPWTCPEKPATTSGTVHTKVTVGQEPPSKKVYLMR